MRSAAVDSSAFMWTYDDWGGWYDHVPPPQRRPLRLRLPRPGAAGEPVRATRVRRPRDARLHLDPEVHRGQLGLTPLARARRTGSAASRRRSTSRPLPAHPSSSPRVVPPRGRQRWARRGVLGLWRRRSACVRGDAGRSQPPGHASSDHPDSAGEEAAERRRKSRRREAGEENRQGSRRRSRAKSRPKSPRRGRLGSSARGSPPGPGARSSSTGTWSPTRGRRRGQPGAEAKEAGRRRDDPWRDSRLRRSATGRSEWHWVDRCKAYDAHRNARGLR